MTSPTPARPPGRPVDPAKRRAVVDAGWELFLAHGITAVGMEAIAARAGVSKVTAYHYFPDKAAVFEAAVLAEMERVEDAQRFAAAAVAAPPGAPAAPPGAALPDFPSQQDSEPTDLRQQLNAFGLGIMHFLASPNAIAFYASLAGELSRHPALAQRFWDAGPGRTRANLARLLAEAADRGQLTVADPNLAAEHLFGLWQGFTNLQHALAIHPEASVETRVSSAVDVFLRAYAPAAPGR